MKKLIKRIAFTFSLVLVILLLVTTGIMAAVLTTPALLETELNPPLAAEGLGFQCYHDTFDALGRHWIFYIDETSSLIYKTATVDGATWSEYIVAPATSLYGYEFSTWYDEPTNTIHYARHEMFTTPDSVVYRMGTPNSNGTITWAAEEQLVEYTPADLMTWRTNICVDELGKPWVAWIDSDNVTPDSAVVYVRSSTTNNGTWTENATIATDNISVGDNLSATFAWIVSIMPVDSNNITQLAWGYEDAVTHQMGLNARFYTNAGGWSADQSVVVSGNLCSTRPDAFSFYDHGSAIWVAYTDNSGAVNVKVKSQVQNWSDPLQTLIKFIPGEIYIPTISGYRMAGSGMGEDLIVIVHCDVDLYYSIYSFDTSNWGSWQHIWTVSDLADVISRHVANYRYYSPLDFAWQATINATGDDSLWTWWIDNTNDTLGYYYAAPSPSTAGNNIINNIYALLLACGTIWIMLQFVFSDTEDIKEKIKAFVITGIAGAVVYTVALAILSALL